MRCGVHGIAASPDGLCVLCRRERGPDHSRTPGLEAIVLGIVLLVDATTAAVPAPSDIVHPNGASSGTTAAAPPLAAAATAAPTDAELRAALSAVPIVMFSASWCGVCDRARAFLRANGCSFVERDIDHDPAANDLLRSRFGRVSVPVLKIDGQLQRPGFNESSIVASGLECPRDFDPNA